MLHHYDVKKPGNISRDASKDGIGAAFLQDTDGQWMPVTYASSSMKAAERNYTHREKRTIWSDACMREIP